MDYNYTTAVATRHRKQTTVLFRKFEEEIEVRVVRELETPFGLGVKTFQKNLKSLTKGMREAKIHTRISTMDEYFHDDLSATLEITGWIPLKSDEHKALLATAEPFKPQSK